MSTSLLVLTIWFGQPPKVHLWIGLENPRYAVREACGRIILHDPKMRWWILRGTVLGSPHTRETCTIMLHQLNRQTMGDIFQCPMCIDGRCKQIRFYTSVPVCGNCGLTFDEHELGRTRTCNYCGGLGWVMQHMPGRRAQPWYKD